MYRYVIVLTSVMAIALAGMSAVLGGLIKDNKETAKKRAILACVISGDIDNPAEVFNQRITVKAFHPKTGKVYTDMTEDTTALQKVLTQRPGAAKNLRYFKEVDMLAEDKIKDPNDRLYLIYEYKNDNGGNYYIMGIVGSGLWDKIWAYVAVDAKGVIQGASFDHKGETPGLGAEIKDKASFASSFKDKKLYSGDEFVSIKVQKRSIKRPDHEVMGISGATITCDGVTAMMRQSLGMYQPFLDGLRKG